MPLPHLFASSSNVSIKTGACGNHVSTYLQNLIAYNLLQKLVRQDYDADDMSDDSNDETKVMTKGQREEKEVYMNGVECVSQR